MRWVHITNTSGKKVNGLGNTFRKVRGEKCQHQISGVGINKMLSVK